MKHNGTLNPPGTSLIPSFCFRLGFFMTLSSSDEEPRDETNPDVQVRSPRWLQDLLQISLRRCQLVGQLVPPVGLAAEIRTVPQEQPAHLLMTSLCSLPKQSQVNVPQTVRDGFLVAPPLVLYLMQRRRAVVIADRWVRSVVQKQSHHIQMTAVRRSMERRGTAGRLRGRTSAVLEEKRAHGDMTAAASVVLK